MSITRQWMLILILTAVISVAVHSLVLSTLINRYYKNYSDISYQEHVSQLADFSEEVLTTTSYTERQLELHYKTHLTDSISRIRLYDAAGRLLADVQSNNSKVFDRMNHSMMRNMTGNLTEETQAVDVVDDNVIVGQLLITKLSSFGSSMAGRMFTVSLIGNSLLSFLLVFVFILAIGIFVSKKMSRDLKMTAKQALEMDLGHRQIAATSRIHEIRTIQQSLEELQTRLKLKQISRKKLVDELIHQTRTPLTILRTHLEGLADGILLPTPDEIRLCEAQVENLTAMITNISGMIDADKSTTHVEMELIDIGNLLNQIMNGLKLQFEQKNIQLNHVEQRKIEIKSDRYKLSQAVYNILTNAYKFSAPGTAVTIDCKCENDKVYISISDMGSGIDAADTARIFDAYYRGSNAAETSGEGIGLYIAQENINQIGGRIFVESQPGRGSTFTISLPLSDEKL